MVAFTQQGLDDMRKSHSNTFRFLATMGAIANICVGAGVAFSTIMFWLGSPYTLFSLGTVGVLASVVAAITFGVALVLSGASALINVNYGHSIV